MWKAFWHPLRPGCIARPHQESMVVTWIISAGFYHNTGDFKFSIVDSLSSSFHDSIENPALIIHKWVEVFWSASNPWWFVQDTAVSAHPRWIEGPQSSRIYDDWVSLAAALWPKRSSTPFPPHGFRPNNEMLNCFRIYTWGLNSLRHTSEHRKRRNQ